jgi:hypothetical protein
MQASGEMAWKRTDRQIGVSRSKDTSQTWDEAASCEVSSDHTFVGKAD